jgi:uncharacterized protein
MYETSVPVLARYLGNLKAILKKAEAHATARKIDPSVILSSRLFPDMLPFSRQIQLSSDMAKSGASRLAGLEPPKFEDTESTFAQLQERLDKTLAHLKSFSAAQIDGSEERPVTVNTARGPITQKGQVYLTQFLLPNFFFHVTTAHDILRHNGVELGKADYLGTA